MNRAVEELPEDGRQHGGRRVFRSAAPRSRRRRRSLRSAGATGAASGRPPTSAGRIGAGCAEINRVCSRTQLSEVGDEREQSEAQRLEQFRDRRRRSPKFRHRPSSESSPTADSERDGSTSVLRIGALRNGEVKGLSTVLTGYARLPRRSDAKRGRFDRPCPSYVSGRDRSGEPNAVRGPTDRMGTTGRRWSLRGRNRPITRGPTGARVIGRASERIRSRLPNGVCRGDRAKSLRPRTVMPLTRRADPRAGR